MVASPFAQTLFHFMDSDSLESPIMAGVDPVTVIAAIALGLSLWANYGNIRSTILTFRQDIHSWWRLCRRIWIQQRIRMFKSSDTAAAAYLKRQPLGLAVEALDRLAGGMPGVPHLHGRFNRITFAMVEEDTDEIAGFVHKYYVARTQGDKSEMDKWLGIMGFAMGGLLYKYHALLRVPIALNMVPALAVEDRLVDLWLNEIGEKAATIRWHVFENLDWGAPIISEGYVCLVKEPTGMWRTESSRLLK